MAFEVRCPECRAKLRLDEKPAADEAIECPRCGNQFAAAAARIPAVAAAAAKKDRPTRDRDEGGKPAVKEKKPAGGKKAKAGAAGVPKKRKAKKKKSNRTILTLMLAGALVILGSIGGMAYILLSKSGKLESMLVSVPGDCNLVRGVNVGQITRYNQYKSEADRMMAGPLKDCWGEIASALSLPKDQDSPEYAVIAKAKAGATGTVLVYRTRAPITDPKGFGAALGGSEQAVNGQTAYRVGGGGSLAGAVVYAPTDRVIVAVLPGSTQSDLLQKSVTGRQQPEGSFYGKMGRTGRKVTAGNIWALVRAEGDLRDYTKDLVKPIDKDFAPLPTNLGKSPLFGIWTSFGARGITFGAGFQCDSPESAAATITALRDGPLGKGDDQPEIPNALKKAYSAIASKEFSEFLSNLKFSSSGDCAYMESRMSTKEKARQALTTFANPGIGDSGSGGFGGPPAGFGGQQPPGGGGRGPKVGGP